MSATGSAAAPTVGVLSSRPLWAEAVSRSLQAVAVTVVAEGDAGAADVLVLVEPDDAHWSVLRRAARPAVLVNGAEPSVEQLFELVEAGLHGVLPNDCAATELARALECVAAGGTALTALQVRRLSDAVQARARPSGADAASISKREREILVAIESGLSVKQTARKLEISPRTVENTQRHLFRKLGVRNRSQAVAQALDLGMLEARPEEARP